MRELFKESYIYVEDYHDIDLILNELVNSVQHRCFIFDKLYLKNNFLEAVLYYMNGDATIFNCNTSFTQFKNESKTLNSLLIYDNVHKCKDEQIVDWIKENKGILIC